MGCQGAAERRSSRPPDVDSRSFHKPNRLREREARVSLQSVLVGAVPVRPAREKARWPPARRSVSRQPLDRLQERCTHPAAPSPTREPLAGASGAGRPDGAPAVEPAATDRPDLDYCAADAPGPRTRCDRRLGRASDRGPPPIHLHCPQSFEPITGVYGMLPGRPRGEGSPVQTSSAATRTPTYRVPPLSRDAPVSVGVQFGVGGGTRALTPHLELTGERTIPAA